MTDINSSEESFIEESLVGENDDVASYPTNADPKEIVERKVPADIFQKYEVYSYKNAAVILSEVRQAEFAEICSALRTFSITKEMIVKAGGNESDMPKLFSASLRPMGWHETIIRADLEVTLSWREKVSTGRKKATTEPRSRVIRRERYMDGHKIDYVKGTVAFDLEWNSKDQTFDRDLYAFNAFFLSGAIDVAVLVTRSESLNAVFRDLGIMPKYGASTTWMGKLLYRMNAGRNGGCPVLVVGITPACVSDWTAQIA
jgi:CRISPR-associated protein Csd2